MNIIKLAWVKTLSLVYIYVCFYVFEIIMVVPQKKKSLKMDIFISKLYNY